MAVQNFFDIDVKHMPISNLVSLIRELSEANVIMSKNIDYNTMIDLELKQVDVQQILIILRDKYGINFITRNMDI